MCFLLTNSSAQETIQFSKLTFSEAKEKAKKENKLIFLDGYTSWCAPCKWMESNVFTQPNVASFFNSNFINTKYDCEVGEGIELAKTYGIRSFPTYLFIDSEGILVYRTQSKMEADQFLNEAKKAVNSDYQLPTLRERFAAGDDDPAFLLRYIAVMNQADQKSAQEAKAKIDAMADPAFLKSKDGWAAIQLLAQNGSDKYGMFFIENKEFFKKIAPIEEFEKKEQQLLRYAMYGYIRQGNEAEFKSGLVFFTNSKSVEKQVEGAMFEVDWVATNGTEKEFITLTNKLRKGVLKDQSENLSFIARRYSSKYDPKKQPSKLMLKQCYELAKQAVKLDEDSYSNQGTFAEIAINLNKKKEAVRAAQAARGLAELETSKIIGIADKLLARAKAM